MHCYRATLETVIASKRPDLRRAGLKTVSNAHRRSFKEYAEKATSVLRSSGALDVDPDTDFDTEVVREQMSRWWHVVAFYSLRLTLAPLVETVMLLDRCLYLYENGHECALMPIFEPKVSPRNHVLVSVKK